MRKKVIRTAALKLQSQCDTHKARKRHQLQRCDFFSSYFLYNIAMPMEIGLFIYMEKKDLNFSHFHYRLTQACISIQQSSFR